MDGYVWHECTTNYIEDKTNVRNVTVLHNQISLVNNMLTTMTIFPHTFPTHTSYTSPQHRHTKQGVRSPKYLEWSIP